MRSHPEVMCYGAQVRMRALQVESTAANPRSSIEVTDSILPKTTYKIDCLNTQT